MAGQPYHEYGAGEQPLKAKQHSSMWMGRPRSGDLKHPRKERVEMKVLESLLEQEKATLQGMEGACACVSSWG